MKNREILQYLSTVEQATSEEIYDNCPSYSYYCNWAANFGKVLSPMVKAGMIERVKPGVFRIGKGKKSKAQPEIPDTQGSLF